MSNYVFVLKSKVDKLEKKVDEFVSRLVSLEDKVWKLTDRVSDLDGKPSLDEEDDEPQPGEWE